jgi:hypothetical protein
MYDADRSIENGGHSRRHAGGGAQMAYLHCEAQKKVKGYYYPI